MMGDQWGRHANMRWYEPEEFVAYMDSSNNVSRRLPAEPEDDAATALGEMALRHSPRAHRRARPRLSRPLRRAGRHQSDRRDGGACGRSNARSSITASRARMCIRSGSGSRSTSVSGGRSTPSAPSSTCRSSSRSGIRRSSCHPPAASRSCSTTSRSGFPELRLIGGHTGWPWTEELIAMAWKHPNVYIAVSGHSPKYWDPKLVSFLNARRRGIGKVMWGTDHPLILHEEGLAQIDADGPEAGGAPGAAARHGNEGVQTGRTAARADLGRHRRGEDVMRIGYLIDLNKGGYDQPMPSPQDAHDTMDAMIEEGIIAERAGFHSLQIPDRHGRTECYFPGPEQILTILARETDKVAIGTFTFVATLFHPMKAAEQFAVIDNLSKGRLYTTMSRGLPPGLLAAVRHPAGAPARAASRRRSRSGSSRSRASASTSTASTGRSSRACSRRSPTSRAAGRSGAAAMPRPGHPPLRRRTARADVSTPSRIMKEVWDERQTAYDEQRAGARQGALHRADARRLGGRHLRGRGAQFGTHFVEEMALLLPAGHLHPSPGASRTKRTSPPESAAPAPDHGHAAAVHRAARALSRGVRRRLLHDPLPVPDRAVDGAAQEQIQRFGEEVVQPIHKKYPAPNHPAIPVACQW